MHGKPTYGALRTRVYVDGYNFYYGCLKGTPYKWLDLLPLFESHILPSVQAHDYGQGPHRAVLVDQGAVKFFTAKIIENVASASDSVSSQARYHTALRKLHHGRVELIEGYYAVNKMKVRIVDADKPNRPPRDCSELQAWKVEEKQSDVNLALHAYHDAITDLVDQVVIVTNDTDIAPALEMIRKNTSVRVGLVVPTSDRSRVPNTELAKQADWVRTHVTKAELAACQMPRVIPGRKATAKPESWYARPDLLQQMLSLAVPICGDRGKAFKWLETRNEYMGGHRPIDLLETEDGALQVRRYIQGWLARKDLDT